ncbi:MAG TPA: hypothetical protein VNA20_03805 [Frankiaceae bacterium]|nr:hypothetical protein [Frankiaceae bacterium]
MTELTAPPDGYTQVLASVPREHAIVVHGLLDSNGIPTVVVGARMGAHLYTREPSHVLSVYVVNDRADEARALLDADPDETDQPAEPEGGDTTP